MNAGRVGVAVGLVVFLSAMGCGVSYALWSTSASTSAQVKAATVTLTVDGSAAAPLSGEFRPGIALTAPVTLANNGSANLVYTAAVSSTGGTLAPSAVTILIWKVASAADCSSAAVAPADAWAGTLAGLNTPPSEPLSAGATEVLCVRTAANVTQAEQGQTAAANLVFTGSNGWQSSGTLAVSPVVYTVPNPGGTVDCTGITSQKSVTLGWQAVAGASAYRLYFTPAVTPAPSPAYLQVAGTSATISGDNFDTVTGSSQGSGSVSIRAIVDGWESSGVAVPIYFAPNSTGSNAKIACSVFP